MRPETLFYIFYLPPLMIEAVDLPPCPTNMQFFPQQLPMHCKMSKEQMEGKPPFLPPPFMAQSGQFPMPMPFPSLQGLPGMPPMFQFPGGSPKAPQGIMQGPFPMPAPMPMPQGPMPMPPPGPMPMPMGMPMGMPMPFPQMGPHIPPLVMPIYKQQRNKHKAPKRRAKQESESEESIEEQHQTRRHYNRHDRENSKILTPVLQYVTKDGYVIYEKEISGNEAKNWLNFNKKVNEDDENETTELVLENLKNNPKKARVTPKMKRDKKPQKSKEI